MSWGGHGNTWGSQGGNGSCRGSENGSMGLDCFSFRKTLLPQTKAYLKQCNPKPSAKWTKALNTFIKGLIADGNWALLDRLWLFNTDYQQNARISLVNPTSTQITEVNSPSWTKNVGYTGNGTSMYLNTNFNPATQGKYFTLNLASMGFYMEHIDLSTEEVDLGVYDGTNLTRLIINYNGTGGDEWSINSTSNVINTGSPGAAGMYVGVRSSSTTYSIYYNGISYASGSNTANTIPSLVQYIMTENNSGTPSTAYSKRTYSMVFYGSGSINQAKLYSRFSNFLTNL